ncbi:MAG: SGNH/GDSL hydrolase family protein [Planctomycetota bacterium]|jgi:lysophospholipase L1-like esterase
MPQPTSSRARRSRVGLFLFLILLLGGAWEIAVRAMGLPTQTPLRVLSAAWVVAGGGSANAPDDEQLARMAYRPLPYLMWGLKPSWTRESRGPGDDREYTSNALGFRGAEVEVPKPAGRYRIVCLGGSTTYSDAVGDADAYPRLMQQMLREARPDRDIEVINAGVPSYTTAESLANLAFRVLDLQPDAIVVYHACNDYRVRVYRNFDDSYFHYRKIWDGSARLHETGEGDMGGLNSFIQFLPPEDNGSHAKNAESAGTWAYRRNLVSMAGMAAAHGARTVLVNFVADEQGVHSTQELTEAMAEHNAVMRSVAEEQGALYIDLHAQFPQGQDLFHTGDPVHLNARGTRVKARIIADGLLKGLL